MKTIFMLLIGIGLFIIGTLIYGGLETETETKIVDCYDYNNNKILGNNCLETTYADNFLLYEIFAIWFTHFGVLLSVLGILFLPFELLGVIK